MLIEDRLKKLSRNLLSNFRIFNQTICMRNLTATICLTLAVFLTSAGMFWSADLIKEVKAKH
tara:strand:+ start:292 stop:477 length:186 start_codon:yes stop_codon:yes gene_type:complete